MDKLRQYLKLLSQEQKKAFENKAQVKITYLRKAMSAKHQLEPATCVRIEQATDGLIRRQDLLKNWRDIWPELAKKAA